eukprot:641420-Amphidinium_carterae.1
MTVIVMAEVDTLVSKSCGPRGTVLPSTRVSVLCAMLAKRSFMEVHESKKDANIEKTSPTNVTSARAKRLRGLPVLLPQTHKVRRT